MAKRRRDGADPADDEADLDAPEHAWWAAAPNDPFDAVRRPAEPPAAGSAGSAGSDTRRDRDADGAAEAHGADAPSVASNPYGVLRVAPDAPWDEVVAAHRKLVRWWHPDGLGPDASDEERELSAERMRELAAAYAEVRVRRGR